MKRTVTMMLILCLFAFTAYGQYWGGWTGGLGTADADTLPAYGQGMAVDGAGKIWYTSYYSSETVMVDTGSGTADDAQNVRAIYVFNPDGTPASFSPITELSVDGVNDTLWNSNRGLRTDHNGDIIAGSWCMYYRINHLTGEGMDKLTPFPTADPDDSPWDGESITAAAVDADGNMYCNAVVASVGAIKAFDPDWELIDDLVPADVLGGYSRTIEVASDGSAVYHCNFTGAFGLVRFNSSSGDVYGDFTADVDSLFPGLSVEATGWDPAGRLWVGNTAGAAFTNCAFYAFDPTTETMVDSFIIGASHVAMGIKPRGIDFAADGNTAYVTYYNSWDNDAIYKIEKDVAGVWSHTGTMISGYALKANYPNPFNPSTKLDVVMKDGGVADLRIYDMRGAEVAVLNNNYLSAGEHTFTFNAADFAAGVYIAKFTANGAMYTQSMTLVK
ncbi:MAG: T9SS type A sorting domain-containing protein [Candidatus Marinimicrobia bacterium]|jgi:hypothetical protein|nr:T9SS type A sorting domain-containing protein [Candidatus Neomarinimicrobiota bacterium]MBT3630055.1 T9SS type A sorting domain-containing protein [Candidatus Neomarinimicrobiota bacterium]MBT3824222.1 T9SS type A sorting domain-containing protein [Candidatus Neomarinimicrobiota bacterium]MBT4130155.1 T9SS type A sorting domain-containing protein [Candidatus Neomarinimicrobiota bacterium]MBT4295496.1 T9SS type A sorting domain-containing protein [Candidatus Neomarinimicrobiota bacterium]